MSPITGEAVAPSRAADVLTGVDSGSTQAKVLDAVVACAGRWGIDKTTVGDVAREAGVSRATVYRLFPGGKPAMVHLCTVREVAGMLDDLVTRIETCTDLDDVLTTILSEGSRMVEEQPAIAYMRSHEPAALRAFFSFDRLDRLFELITSLVSPSLHRFLGADDAAAAVTWCARLVVSHSLNPTESVELSDRSAASELVRSFILPGFESGPVGSGGVTLDPQHRPQSQFQHPGDQT